jgi:hypothetical protein
MADINKSPFGYMLGTKDSHIPFYLEKKLGLNYLYSYISGYEEGVRSTGCEIDPMTEVFLSGSHKEFLALAAKKGYTFDSMEEAKSARLAHCNFNGFVSHHYYGTPISDYVWYEIIEQETDSARAAFDTFYELLLAFFKTKGYDIDPAQYAPKLMLSDSIDEMKKAPDYL